MKNWFHTGRCAAALLCLALYGLAAHAQSVAPPEGTAPPVKEVRVASDRFERKAALPAWVDSAPALPATQSKNPLVTLLADVQFMASPKPVTFVHRAWQPNASAAVQALGNMTIPFNPEYHRVQLHILRVIRNGQTLDKLATADIRFLQRETGLDSGTYNGEITASILVDDLRTGDTLEFAYSQEGANPVIGNRFVDYTNWDHTTPIELRRVTLTHPLTRKVNTRFLGDLNKNYPQPVESTSGGMRKLRWEQRALPPIDMEEQVPYSFNVARSLQMSEFQSWGEVSDWAVQLFNSTQPLPDELQQVVKTLAAKPTADERVSGALQWVQNEIRYFSVSLGESSHRPSTPALTLQRRYGDCKDKSFMLIEMLKALGIKAQPVLVSSRTWDGLPRNLPSPYAFDHAIVRAEVDGKAYFLDPTRTGQVGRLSTMGQPYEGMEVLVIEPGNNNFTRIKSDNFAAISRNELSEKITVPKFDSEGTLESRHLWSGTSAEIRRLQLAAWTPEQRNRLVLENYERRYPGARFAVQPVIEDDTVNNVVTIISRYTIPKVANLVKDEWGVRYTTPNLTGMVGIPASSTRTQPLAMEVTPRKHRYSVEIEFPPEVSVTADPSARSVRDEAFEYHVNSSFRGNRAASVVELTILKSQVEAARVPAYAESLRRTGEIFFPVFVVRKTDVKSAGFFGTKSRTLKQALEQRGTDRIEKLTKSIDSGRLTGDDLANALCQRAETQSEFGQVAEALKDAQQAVKSNPNLARAYACRGNVYFGMSEHAKAIVDFSKAISLGDTGGYIFYRRGHARFYSGQLAAAAEDFAKAGQDKSADTADVLYAELWRVWTQKRLSITPEAAQLDLAKADPRGSWPRPALAMLHGLMTPEAALATLDEKKGDDREMALAEGYFYVGQHYYAQGDKAKAADYFKKAREKGVFIYIEHTAAGFELLQMSQAKP